MYKVSPSLNTNDLIKIFVAGPEDEVVTIIPGTTLEEIADLLDKSGIVERNDFIKADPKNYVTECPFCLALRILKVLLCQIHIDLNWI